MFHPPDLERWKPPEYHTIVNYTLKIGSKTEEDEGDCHEPGSDVRH